MNKDKNIKGKWDNKEDKKNQTGKDKTGENSHPDFNEKIAGFKEKKK